MKIEKINIVIKSIIYLSLCLGLNACFFKTDEEKIADFNRTYRPNYKLTNDDLFVHWKGDKQASIEPINLKIPLVYLENNSERIRRGEKFYWLGMSLEPMKNRKIERVKIELLRSNSQPVPYTDYKKTDPQKEIAKKNKYIEDSYRFSISEGANYRRSYYSSKYGLLDRGYFRARDNADLENYREMKCFTEKEIEELKQEIQPKVVGYEFKQQDLDALNNKQKNDDQSPKNCITQETGRGTYWLSPDNVSNKDRVLIKCWFACEIFFTYKNIRIAITATGGERQIVPQWKSYRQQVIDLLNHFEKQADQSQTKL